jgi:translation initiation factor 4E
MTSVASQQVPLDTIPISPEGTMSSNGDSNPNAPFNSEPVTVFHDPENFTVKHPLMNKWTLWFTKPPTGKVNKHLLPC